MKKNFILTLTLFTLAVSCSDTEHPPLVKNDLEMPDSRNLTEDEAVVVLTDFIRGFESTKNTSTDVTIRISKKKTVADYAECNSTIAFRSASGLPVSVDTIPIYEFDISNGDSEGFALVVGHSLYNDVIAYSDNGSLSDTLFNEGLALFVSSIPESISLSIGENYQPIGSKTKAYWQDNDGAMKILWDTEKYLGPVWSDEEFKKICPYYYGNGPWTEFKTYGTLLFTQWGQDPPYNNNVNKVCPNGKRCRVGCAPVAVAQVLAYHKAGNYNWNVLTASQKILPTSSAASRTEVARLMINLFNNLGTYPKCKEDGTSVGSTDVFMIVPTLNNFGLTGVIQELRSTVNSDTIRNNLSKNMPILMMARDAYDKTTGENLGGHIWVIDGLSERYRYYYQPGYGWENGKEYQFAYRYRQRGLHMHCNWGWYGSSDGWYRFFTPVNQNFGFQNFRLFTQIKPKR